MKYALILDGKITHVQDFRPRKLTSEWRKVVEDSATAKPWETTKYKYSLNEQGEPVEEKIFTPIGLDIWKEKKYAQISSEGQRYILDKYTIEQQTTALAVQAGFSDAYTLEEAQTINGFADKYVKIIRQAKADIMAATTYKAVDEVYFRKVETDENTMEVISETFWGE